MFTQYQRPSRKTNLVKSEAVADILPIFLHVVHAKEWLQVTFQVGEAQSEVKRIYSWKESVGANAKNLIVKGVGICLTGFLNEEKEVLIRLCLRVALQLEGYPPQQTGWATLKWNEVLPYLDRELWNVDELYHIRQPASWCHIL